jgi:hypothetical protein
VNLNPKIRGAPPRHFLLQYKGNMFLVSKCKLIILLASTFSKTWLAHQYLYPFTYSTSQ